MIFACFCCKKMTDRQTFVNVIDLSEIKNKHLTFLANPIEVYKKYILETKLSFAPLAIQQIEGKNSTRFKTDLKKKNLEKRSIFKKSQCL